MSSSMLGLLKDLWVVWGIHLLFAASIACWIGLAIFGSRRKYMVGNLVSIFVWAAYLLLYYFANFALGNLTVVRIDDPGNPGYDVVLQGLLAPLFLMLLGYPDAITAYEVDDNQLALRQTLRIVATYGVVGWILYRCWDGSSPVSRLYFPLLLVGIGKSVGWLRALLSVHDESSSVTAEDIKEASEIRQVFKKLPESVKFASTKDILKAYFRFDCLKPHLDNWLYNPLFISHDWMSIEDYSPNRAFNITEIELNFMFDVLYTKAPVLYTTIGFLGHCFGLLCLVSAFCGFAIIFRSAFLIDMYVTYTYALLMAVTSLELYQIMVMPFSDWAVVKMCMKLEWPLVRTLLPFLADRCMKQKRWSRSIGQLNLLDRFSQEDGRKPIDVVLDWFGQGEIFRWWRLLSREPISSYLKELVVQKMAEFDKKRIYLSFKKRGDWTLEIHGIQNKQGLSSSIKRGFDQSIITWHVATEILLKSEGENSDACKGSKILSDYMIYLLALHPDTLSLTTPAITLEYACCILRPFFMHRDFKEAITILVSPDGDVPPPVKPKKETWITHDWNVLLEVQKLVVDLRGLDNKWEIISSIWVEMLCHGAYKGQPDSHARLLRRGGEFITHVWLLLAHKTDKYHSSIDKPFDDTANTSAPATPAPRRTPSTCIQRFFLAKRDRPIY